MSKLIHIALFFLLITACNDGSVLSSQKTDQRLSSVVNDDRLRLELTIDSEEIKTLQDIEAEFSLTNTTADTITFGFPSGCQIGFTIRQNETSVFDSRKEFFCTAALTQLHLEPGKTKVYPIPLALIGDIKELEAGVYRLSAFLLENHSREVIVSFEVR